MAVIYLRSTDGNDSDNGSTWALAKATLAAALTAAGAGGTVYVADGHAESQATAQTLASPGTPSAPVLVVCVDDTGNPEPPTALATTATVTNTGSSMTFSGCAYYYGITFTVGSGSTQDLLVMTAPASGHFVTFVECELAVTTNSSLQSINFGGTGGSQSAVRISLINTDLRFANNGQEIEIGACQFEWKGGTVLGTAPTTLFNPTSSGGPAIHLIAVGVDFSLLGSNNIFIVSIAQRFRATFVDCKLGASATLTTGSFNGQGSGYVQFVNCDSTDTNYRYAKRVYEGSIDHETTIVRTGGASDGTTPVSRKMVSSANTFWYAPLSLDEVVFWNETIGSSVTVTIPVITDNVTLTDAEAWVEVEYLGTSGFPWALFASDRLSTLPFGTPSNQPTDGSSTWTTTGLTTPVKQSLAVSFTPQEKGPVRVRVMLAKPSTTMYVDPKALATSGRQYQSADQYVNEGASSSGGVNRAALPSGVSALG